jgi:hypothetical protein
MSQDFSDRLRLLVDDAARAYAVTATSVDRDIALLAGRAQRRRTARRAGVAAAVAAALVMIGVGVAVAPRPQPPALPTPAVTTPGPTPTTSPSSSPTSRPTSTAAARPAAAPYTRGIITAYPQKPHARWTIRSTDLVPGWDRPGEVWFGDVRATPHGSEGHVPVIAAGDTWVLAVVTVSDSRIVGVDATTGAVRWILPPDSADSPTTSQCVGVDPSGMVVCLGGSTVAGPGIQLIDPATGHITRTLPLDASARSIGLAGDVVISHGVTTPAGPAGSVRVDATDVSSGALIWSHVEPGVTISANTAGMDPGAGTSFVGSVAFLSGAYALSIDVATGEVHHDDPVTTEMSDAYVWSRPTEDPGPAIETLTGSSGALSGMSARTRPGGTLLWTYQKDDGTTPAGVIGGTLIASSPNNVLMLDLLTGVVRATTVPGMPIATDGASLVIDRGATISAVRLSDGSPVWSWPGTGYTEIVDQHVALVGIALDELTVLDP